MATEILLRQRIEELEAEVRTLREAASRDGLTGCLRREAFLSLTQERKQFGWLPAEATLVIADIDHFKKVNDTYGHLNGDLALQAFARTLMANLPEGGLVCRMGGEEFVVLLEGSLADNAAALERLRVAVESTRIRLQDGAMIQITASFGAATWRTDHAMLAATARADAALYRAKHGGRNRVEVDAEFRQAS